MGTVQVREVVIVAESEGDREEVRSSGMLDILQRMGVRPELSVVSAHSTSADFAEYLGRMVESGTRVFVSVSRSAAFAVTVSSMIRRKRPVIAAFTPGGDPSALISIARIPEGVPVTPAGNGRAGLVNAALLSCQFIAQRSTFAADMFAS